jgi:hypothetical protein
VVVLGAPALTQASGEPPRLALPIACVLGKTCEVQNYMDRDTGPGAKDYRCGSRTYDAHSGVDFRLLDLPAQRAGVDVLAAADGKVLRMRDGVADLSVRQVGPEAIKGRECGNGLVIEHAGGLSTQYCHMAKNSLVVKPGDLVRAGARLGKVGLSGNTEYPHLHFTVMRDGATIDPFAPEPSRDAACGSGPGLWRTDLATALAYKPRAVLNTGFASGPITMDQVEAGGLKADAASPALVAYARAIGLKAGDVGVLTVTDPSGRVLAASRPDTAPRDQAQRLLYAGKARPAGGWPKGRYEAVYSVKHDGAVVLERRWSVTL